MKKLSKKLGILFLVASVLVTSMSCKNNILRKGTGPQAKIGDIITFNFTVKKDTATLFSSSVQGQPAQEILKDPTSVPDPFYKFLTQSLLSLHQGDSASFNWKIDTMKVKPRGLETAKIVLINIGVNDLKNEKDFLATLPPEQQKQFMMQKKSAAAQERLTGMKAQIQASGDAFVAAAPAFAARSKAVADSATALAAKFASNTLPSNVQTTPSGLKYLILKEGTGKVSADGDYTFVQYYGCTKAGKRFDESFQKGQPFPFLVGIQPVIPAWDEAVKIFKEGTTGVIFVPAALAYGAKGQGKDIAPNTDLVFYMEILKTF